MAQVRFAGSIIKARPLEQLATGDWLMEAQGHGPRFAVGTKIKVKKSEIVEMAAAEMPMAPSTLAPGAVAPLLINPNLPPLTKPGIVPVKPQPLAQDNDEMSKLSQLAATAAETHKEIEAGADASLDRLTHARTKAKAGLAKLDKLSDAVEKGITDIEDMANQISNGGPPLA
jgi:hypothetical protein